MAHFPKKRCAFGAMLRRPDPQHRRNNFDIVQRFETATAVRQAPQLDVVMVGSLIDTPPNPGGLSPHSGEIERAYLRGYSEPITPDCHSGACGVTATALPPCLHAVNLPEPPLILVENGGGQTTASSGEKQRTQTKPQCHILLVLGYFFRTSRSIYPA